MRKKWSLGSSMALVLTVGLVVAGCGGGGGGGMRAVDPMPPPGPTDEEKIAAERATLAGLVTDARAQAQAASSAASVVETHDDATDTQIANARSLRSEAADALTDIMDANAAVNTATTPAQAESAVGDARAALSPT